MRQDRVLELLARARMSIDTAAIQIAEGLCEQDAGKIEGELVEVKARVDALEARVLVWEARKDEQ